MRDINLPENKKLIDNSINSFNHQYPKFEPLETNDFYSSNYKQYHYMAFISDNGNVTLEFPIVADSNPASIVISESFEIIKSNNSFKKELERLKG